jgi:N-methylhydantoinase A
MSCWAGSTPTIPIGGKLSTGSTSTAPARAIDTHVGAPLGLTTTEAAAEAILTVANSRMAGAIRLVSASSAASTPRSFAFMPFGGGGALHAGAMLKRGRDRPGASCHAIPA